MKGLKPIITNLLYVILVSVTCDFIASSSKVDLSPWVPHRQLTFSCFLSGVYDFC